jgi:hypothetical protein
MKFFCTSAVFLAMSLLSLPLSAAEVWAYGVDQKSGWVDYDKEWKFGDPIWADDAMCWAASGSNVISWWQELHASSLTSSVPRGAQVWDTFRYVFQNTGGVGSDAFEWWFYGTDMKWGGELDKETAEVATAGQQYLFNGGFLNYLGAQNAVSFKYIEPDYTGCQSIVDILSQGCAITLSATYGADGGGGHAITLWGAEYEQVDGKTLLTKVWLTDSDDKAKELVDYDVVLKEGTNPGLTGNGSLNGYVLRSAAALNPHAYPVDVVPEPSSAMLCLLSLMGCVARRRRYC